MNRFTPASRSARALAAVAAAIASLCIGLFIDELSQDYGHGAPLAAAQPARLAAAHG